MIQSVRAGRVRLKPPYRKGERLPEVEINVVFVEEINPPDGEEPITWLLLTSLAVDTFEQACLVVEYYLCRWQIEIYFKVLKSGCKIEDRQFETSERIKPCIALYMILISIHPIDHTRIFNISVADYKSAPALLDNILKFFFTLLILLSNRASHPSGSRLFMNGTASQSNLMD